MSETCQETPIREACGVRDVTDYSQASSWHLVSDATKDIDTFFIYPTEYMGTGEGDPDFASLDNEEMLAGVAFDHLVLASAFEDSTNLFMPYYRQASMRCELEASRRTGSIEAVLSTIPYADIVAALDYYFDNYNEGRPFILASHSQGSAIASLVLKDYFKEHQARYERMVAAYIIGFSITKDYLAANPHLRFARGESDAGVIISWNTEGRQNVETHANNMVVLPEAISINPLNWRLDETYAPATANLGSLVINEEAARCEIRDIGADAQLNLERGVNVTNANAAPIALPECFGPQSFHNGDYMFYYNNIKDNVAKRIATYRASR